MTTRIRQACRALLLLVLAACNPFAPDEQDLTITNTAEAPWGVELESCVDGKHPCPDPAPFVLVEDDPRVLQPGESRTVPAEPYLGSRGLRLRLYEIVDGEPVPRPYRTHSALELAARGWRINIP